ncbi:MAG: DNA polymerase IV [Planctomycetota bacterium]
MILHIDMDAFYASIEIRDNPELAGLPVVVGGSPQGRGVISAASYEARRFGVHSAMSSAEALRRCRDLVFIRPRMNHYAAISKQIRNIFFKYTSLVEPIAFDEAFLDVNGCERLFGDAVTIARKIKNEILNETGLVASAGVAPNKFLAKLASDLEKPDGLTVVDPERVQAFLDPLPIKRIWGIGKATEQKFLSLGVRTVRDLRQLPKQTMQYRFGILSDHFWNLSRGIDSRSVVPDRHAKSISHETTFRFDIDDVETLKAWTLELSDQVARRLRRYEILGRTVNLKVRFNDFRTITRSNTLSGPTCSSKELSETAANLLVTTLAPSNRLQLEQGVRLLGVGVSNLKRPHDRQQMLLFDQQENEKMDRFDQASDQIKDKFGAHAIRRASSVERKVRHRDDPLHNDQ